MENTYTLNREELDSIIEALGYAQLWVIQMGNDFPYLRNIYDKDNEQFIDLEEKLRGLVGSPLALNKVCKGH